MLGQIKNPGIMSCIFIIYTSTYDKNLELIQPLLQELSHFLCFWFWPPGGQAKDQTAPKFYLWDTLVLPSGT
jgi:hypothetical protein